MSNFLLSIYLANVTICMTVSLFYILVGIPFRIKRILKSCIFNFIAVLIVCNSMVLADYAYFECQFIFLPALLQLGLFIVFAVRIFEFKTKHPIRLMGLILLFLIYCIKSYFINYNIECNSFVVQLLILIIEFLIVRGVLYLIFLSTRVIYCTPLIENIATQEQESAIPELVMPPELFYTKPGILIDQVAPLFGMSKRSLSNHLNTVCNQNFNTWINTLRVEYAKGLMNSVSDLNIKQISQLSGFPNTSMFYREFKKKTGVTPQTYLNSLPVSVNQHKIT